MAEIPSEGHAYCRSCTGTETPLWRYSANDYQLDADCVYSSVAACEKENNPRKSYVDPTQCLVFFNDDGHDWLLNGVNLFDGAYGETNQQKPIPSVLTGTLVPHEGIGAFLYRYNPPLSPAEDLTALESRLWAYDIESNITYYVDAFTVSGPDVAMSHSKLFLGCNYSLQSWRNAVSEGCLVGEPPVGAIFDWSWAPETSTCPPSLYRPATVAINSYDYTLTNNDLSTWRKVPHKTYRFVDENGEFITKGDWEGATTAGNFFEERPNLGMGIASISDTELIIDDKYGNLYYADLTNYWTGTTATTFNWMMSNIWFATGSGWSLDPSFYTYQTSNAVDVQGNPYFDLTQTGYSQMERKPEDGVVSLF